MLFADIDIIDSNFRYQPHRWVGVVGDTITYVGEQAPEDVSAFGRVYKGEGRLLMPGLYNAHSHVPMVLLRGLGEGLPLQSWLSDAIFPFEDKITEDDMYWGTLLGCAEALRYGTVSMSDMYYFGTKRFDAVADSGMKMNLGECMTAFDAPDYTKLPLFEKNLVLQRDYHGTHNGRLLLDYNLHAEYTNNEAVSRQLAQAAAQVGARMQVHVSETKREVEECKQRHNGMTPVQYLDSIGMFDVPCTAAHCVWLEEGDYAILRDKNVTVALNPVSNCKLGSGFAPVARLMQEGITLALGTDGCASNNNHDMFQDMYVLGLVAKGSTCDPTVLTPSDILRIATRNGALSQGRTDCGLVAEGMKADLCVVDTTGPSWTPNTFPESNLVYAAHGNNVRLTMVDGHVCYENGSWPQLDFAEVKQHCTQSTTRILTHLAAERAN